MHPYSQLDDFQLLQLVKAGEEEAFRLIYDRYWDKLYIIARNSDTVQVLRRTITPDHP